MSSKRKAFNFYQSHWEQIKLLNDKQKLELFNSICSVQFLEVDIDDIKFDDQISTLVWTGIKHSISTSLTGFINKNKSLAKGLNTPLAKGLGKGLAKGGAQQEEGEEEEEEKEQVQEEEKEENKLRNTQNFSNSTQNDFKSQIKDWLDSLNYKNETTYANDILIALKINNTDKNRVKLYEYAKEFHSRITATQEHNTVNVKFKSHFLNWLKKKIEANKPIQRIQTPTLPK